MAKVIHSPRGTQLYERDFQAWAQQQAALLKAGRLADIDLEHLAQEIEDMGREQRHAVRSQLRQLLVHLLKLRYSPAIGPRPGWIEEVQNARAEIEDRLDDNLGLKPELPALFAGIWPQARRQVLVSLHAHGQTPDLPESCPFTLEQVLDDSDWPG